MRLNDAAGYRLLFQIFRLLRAQNYSAEEQRWRVAATLSTALLPPRSGLSFCIVDLAQMANGRAT